MATLSKRCLLNQKSNNNLVALVFCRFMTSSADAKPQRLSRNLSYRPAYDSKLETKDRPLVLLYSWLVAKARHIHKYGDFYLGKGFDVLHIKIQPQQLIWPKHVHLVTEQIVNFTQEEERSKQPILIHGFSVGGYLYGETLVNILSSPKTAEGVGGRIKGQILDSPVDYQGIPYGVSQAVTQIPILQKTMQLFLQTYLQVFHNQVTVHYHRSSSTFRANQLNTPALFLYSRSDPVADDKAIEDVMDGFVRQGADVYSKSWDRSPHVSHLHNHPVEYIGALNRFISVLGLGEKPEQNNLQEVDIEKRVAQSI